MENYKLIGRQVGAQGDVKMTAEMKAIFEASYSLSIEEQKILFLAVIEAGEQNIPIKSGNKVWIKAETYARIFNVDIETASANMLKGGMDLFDAWFEYQEVSPVTGHVCEVKSRWISSIATIKNAGAIGLDLAVGVIASMKVLEVGYIIHGLKQVGGLTGAYALRLYEMLIQWKDLGKTPELSVEDLRLQLGLSDEYLAMSDFKKRVLDLAITKINEHTDIDVCYKQRKNGRVIRGFIFNIELKAGKHSTVPKTALRDVNTCDMFTECELTDKQLATIVANPKFKSDYVALIASTHPACFSAEQWEAEMVSRIKKNPSQFDKRPLEYYLDC